MRWIKRILTVLLVLIIIVFAAMMLIPGDKIAQLAEDQFEAATGRSMDISGDVRTTVYPLLGVRTGPVAIANAPWSDEGPMLQAEGLSIGISLMGLFGGDIQIKKIEVLSPSIMLEVAKDGRSNWDMSQSGDLAAVDTDSEAAQIPAFSLGHGVIKNGSLTFFDHASGSKTILSNLDADLKLPTFLGQGDLQLTAQMNGQNFALQTTVDNFGGMLNGEISQMQTAFQTGANKVDISGKAGLLPLTADGSVNAELVDMPALFVLMGQEAPNFSKGMGRSAIITADLSYTDKSTAHLRNAKIRLDQNLITGQADLFLAKADRPFLQAQLQAGALDFSVLAASVDETGANVETASGWSKALIDTSGLAALNADVTLSAGPIDLGTVKLGKTQAIVTLGQSRLVFDLQKIETYGGVLTGEFVMNGRKGLSVGGTLKADSVSMQPLLADLADYKRLSTTGDFQVEFLSSGTSVHAIMNNLSGDGSLNFDQGALSGIDLVGMLRNRDASYRGGEQKTVFQSISATFIIKGGVLYNDDLTLLASKATAQGAGEIGIGARTLNYRVTPVGFGEISVPVLITGTWEDPKFRPDLKGLIDQNLAAEKAALAAKIAAQKAAAAAKAKEALGITTQEGESTEDAVKRKLEEEAKRGLLDLLGNN